MTLVFACLVLCLACLLSSSYQLNEVHYLHWNRSNPVFHAGRNVVFRVNMHRESSVFDQAHIICPFYPGEEDSLGLERYIVYNVTKSDYDNCRVSDQTSIVAMCDQPLKMSFVTMTFRPFSPTPGGFEFFPGKDYFFISTSSMDNIRQLSGGACQTDNMRVVFQVVSESDRVQKDQVVLANVDANYRRQPRIENHMSNSQSKDNTHKTIYLLSVILYSFF